MKLGGIAALVVLACLCGCAGPSQQNGSATALDSAEAVQGDSLAWPSRIASGVRSLAAPDFPCGRNPAGEIRCWTTDWLEPVLDRTRASQPGAVIAQWQATHTSPVAPGAVSGNRGRPPEHRLLSARQELLEVIWPDAPTPFGSPGPDFERTVTAASVHRDGGCVSFGADVLCWGGPFDTWAPRQTYQLPGRATELSASRERHQIWCCYGGCYNERGHACAVLESGRVACWGASRVGQLGDGSRVSGPRGPVLVEGLRDIRQVAAGTHHTCALSEDGRVWCWGYGIDGQLGDGEHGVRARPTAVVGVTSAVSVHSGDYHSCARLADGDTICWGDPIARGMKRRRGGAHDPFPARLALPDGRRIADLALGGGYTCALDTSGDVWCGGYP